MVRGRCAVSAATETERTDLLNYLRGQRGRLLYKMSNEHQRGGDVSGWLPLLSQTQAAIEAVEAAMRESLTP